MQRLTVTLILGLATLCVPAAAAAQATVDQTEVAKRPLCSTTTRATLTLDQEDQETVTAAAFGRSTEPQPLTLVYRVTGCRVTGDLPRPDSPAPTGPVNTVGAQALPLGSVQIEDVDADGDRYRVYLRVSVSGKDFNLGPGAYTSLVRIKAPWTRTVASPVAVTRSENELRIPLGIGVIGGLCGFFIFWLLRRIHSEDLLVRERWVLWLTAGISVVVGAGTAFVTNYLNQDVWTWEANGLALFIAAFSASTGGVAAGLLTGIYKTSAAPPKSD